MQANDTRPERPVRWVRARQAAEYLGIGESTLYRYRKIGKIPRGVCRRLTHGMVLWDLDALDRFLSGPAGDGPE